MRVDYCSHKTVSFQGEVEKVEDIGNRYSLMHFMDSDDAAKSGTVACMIALETVFKDVDRPWLVNYRDRLDVYLRACLHLNYPAAKQHAFPAMVNGDNIYDRDSFLCEFGSALFGHAGYMGQDLDGFFDILSDIQNPVTIIWTSSREAMARMEKTWPYKNLTSTQLVRDMKRYCDLKLCSMY